MNGYVLVGTGLLCVLGVIGAWHSGVKLGYKCAAWYAAPSRYEYERMLKNRKVNVSNYIMQSK